MNKLITSHFLLMLMVLASCKSKPTESTAEIAKDPAIETSHLFVDVHDLEPGKVDLKAVAGAHQKDLETQAKYGVNILKYWIDQEKGKVYCLAQGGDSASLYNTHKEAHGLVPSHIREVTGDIAGHPNKELPLFLDLHLLGPGNVNAKAVADAHAKDLAIQDKHNANFVNYWVDEKAGTVMCLVEAPDSAAVANAHKEAHGLMPSKVRNVKAGD